MTVFLNKFSKNVFNIILKLNNHTWKKLKKIFFFWGGRGGNERQISGFVGFAVVKMFQVFEKTWSSKRCADFKKKIKGSEDI